MTPQEEKNKEKTSKKATMLNNKGSLENSE
jgi:hypothetical protein